jgi:hypothetical protein
LLSAASEQRALSKQHSPDSARLANDPLTTGLIANPRNQSEAVDSFDDGAHASLLRSPDSFAPGIEDTDVNSVLTQLRHELLMIFFATDLVACSPGRIGGALFVPEENRDSKPLDLTQQLSGTKSIEIRFESTSIQAAENLEAPLFLAAKFEDVAEKSDS